MSPSPPTKALQAHDPSEPTTRYALQHPSYTSQPWHVFVAYILTTWIATAVVCLFNSFMPYLTKIGIFFLLGGYFITVVVCAVMPTLNGRQGHASSSFVWRDWEAEGLGYPNGFVFVAGMLNGAYAMGTPDTVTHLAEEIPNPRRNIPLAILLQYAIGFFTGFTYRASSHSPSSPLHLHYRQAG